MPTNRLPIQNLKIKSMKVVNVTKAKAERWMRNNHCNRKLRPGQVAFFEGLLQRGEMQLTHQGIALDRRHYVLDAQHRLQAIINTGIACKMMVVEFDNVIDDPMDLQCDLGMGRITSDMLEVSKNEAAFAKTVLFIVHGNTLSATGMGVSSNRKATLGEIWETHEVLDGLSMKLTQTQYSKRTPVHARIAVCCRILKHPRYETDIVEQFNHWANRHLNELWPAVVCMENKIAKQIEAGFKTMQPEERMLLTYNAFNPSPSARRRTRLARLRDVDAMTAEIISLLQAACPHITPRR